MRFSYTLWSPDRSRLRPVIPIRITGPDDTALVDATLDSGSDTTLFPASLATVLGLDLANLAWDRGIAVGGGEVPYRRIEAELCLNDGAEKCTWIGSVCFIEYALKPALLGHESMLQYFNVLFFGVRCKINIRPNQSFPGIRERRLHQRR
jgi:hypothetical protein